MFWGTSVLVKLLLYGGKHGFLDSDRFSCTGSGPTVAFKESVNIVFTVNADVVRCLFDLNTVKSRK